MKILMAILTLGFLSGAGLNAGACTDFSGQYAAVIPQGYVVILTLTQNGCTSIDAAYDYGQGSAVHRNITFDGKPHTVIDSPSLKSVEFYAWDGSKIAVTGTDNYLMTGHIYKIQGSFSRDAKGNLVEQSEDIDSNGKVVQNNSLVYLKYPIAH